MSQFELVANQSVQSDAPHHLHEESVAHMSDSTISEMINCSAITERILEHDEIAEMVEESLTFPVASTIEMSSTAGMTEGSVVSTRSATITTSKPQTQRFYQPPVQEERRVAIIGKYGVGKTSIFAALLGMMVAGYAGWRDGSKTNIHQRHDLGDFSLFLTDTKGWRGVLQYDWPILRKLIADLMEESARIDCVFLCFSSTRFSPAEESILHLIRTMTTPEFQACIHVVITHCPPLRVHSEFLEDIVSNLSFLQPANNVSDTDTANNSSNNGAAISEEEQKAEDEQQRRAALLKRVHFVDLMHPDSFEEGSPCRDGILQKWASAQNELYQVMLKTHQAVPVKKIFRISYLQQWYIVYARELHIFCMVVLLGLCIWGWYQATGMNALQREILELCRVEKLSLLNQIDAMNANNNGTSSHDNDHTNILVNIIGHVPFGGFLMRKFWLKSV